MMSRKLLWIAPLAIVGMVAFVGLGGVAVRALWNWLTPELFGWRTITLWQALGLLALCRILFGGFGMNGGSGGRMRQRMAERRAAMTPEEREHMRHGMFRRCGMEPGEPPVD